MTMVKRQKEPNEEHTPADGPSPPTPDVCASTTQYGRPCRNQAQLGKSVCWSHDPENATQRAQNARAGGIAVHSPATLEFAELKDELKALIKEVKDGKVAPGVASVITQLANVLLRGIEQERKVKETEELEQRIGELERRAADGYTRPAA